MLQIGTGKGRGRRALGYIFFLAAAWIALSAVSLHRLTAGEFFWLTTLYVFCTLPTILFVAGHPFRIPLMPMWGLAYFSMFAIPMFSQDVQEGLDFLVSETTVVNALRLAALGAGMCLLGFYTSVGSWIERVVPKIKAPWDSRRAPILGAFLAVLGLGIHYYNLTSSVPSSLAQLVFIGSQLSIVGMVTLFLLNLRGQLPKILTFFLWGLLVPVEFLMGLGTGAIFEVIRSLAPLLFCYAAERGKIPWQAMVIMVLCLIPFAGLKHEYRAIAWYGELGDVTVSSSPIQRGLSFIGLVGKHVTEGGKETLAASAETAQARIGQLGALMIVMEMTPSTVPFWGGVSYQGFFWSVIPRFLFPGKPEMTLGQEFGHRYGLLGEEDMGTSYNLPHQVVEMYTNFGMSGVLFGMLIVGLAYRAIAALLAHPDAGERSLIIGCALLANLLSLDSDFSLVFGGVVYYLILMYFFVRVLRGPSKLALPSGQTP